MKIKLVLLLLVFTIGSLFSQGKVSFAPKMIKIDDVLKIKYDPAGSKLDSAQKISANLLLVKETEPPVWQEVKLAKKGKEWSGDFKIKEKDTRLVLVKFVSGEKTDDNNENVWDIFINGKNKKPLNSAYDSRGIVYSQGDFYGFKKKKDLDKAVSDFNNELKLYPDSWKGQLTLWKIWMRRSPGDETMNKIKSALENVYEENKDNEEALSSLIPWFEQMGQKEKSETIIINAITKKPKGIIAKNNAFKNISAEKDPAKRNMLFEKILSGYDIKNTEKINFLFSIITFYAKERKWDKVESIILENKPLDGRLYSVAAWRMLADSTMTEKSLEFAKKSMELIPNISIEMKPSYVSIKEWRDECNSYLNSAKNSIAKGLMKLSKYAEAEKNLEELYAVESEDKADYAETLIECYIKSGNNEKAFNLSQEVITKYGPTEGVVANLKIAYLKTKGTETGFEIFLDDLKNAAKKAAKDKLMKELVNKPAPDFELKGLDGKSVKLSDLKGKVVVVDFWATWCGPCKSSFPFLQKVYEKYKSNPDIVILALDTWERVKSEEKEKLVNKFIADNKYTFTVLYDENFVEQYGVTGIPTKFIIDKEGLIQFKTIGFSGGDKMMDEMDIQFEILLKGEHKK